MAQNPIVTIEMEDGGVMKAVAVSVILYIANIVSTNCFSLYVTQRLGISDEFLAVFPIANAAVTLVFLVGVQHRLSGVCFRLPMWAGLGLQAGAALLLLSDLAARVVIMPVILPIGALTAFLGGPLFLYLLFKGRGRT